MTVARCTTVGAVAPTAVPDDTPVLTLSEERALWVSARADGVDALLRMAQILGRIKGEQKFKDTHERWEQWLRWAHKDPIWQLDRGDAKWADALIHFPVAYRLIQEGTSGVPLPVNVAQVEPYLAYKDEVLARKWEEAWRALPAERQGDPPSRDHSRTVLQAARPAPTPSHTEHVTERWTPEAEAGLAAEIEPDVIDLTPEERPEDDTYYRLSLEWRSRIQAVAREISHLEGFLVNIRAEHGSDVFERIRAANVGLSGVRKEKQLLGELAEGLMRIPKITNPS